MPRMRGKAIISALPYVIERDSHRVVYEYYVTDQLYYGSRNQSLTSRYYDIVNKKNVVVDERTGDEIAADVINRMGLKL